jgi:nitrate reductase gamma subunit
VSPTLERYLYIPGYLILYVSLIAALSIFVYRTHRLYRFLSLGKKENRLDHIGKRIVLFVTRVFGQWCVLRTVSSKDLAGLGHVLMFWTFVLFFINYAYLFSWAAWHKSSSLMGPGRVYLVFSSVLDFLAIFATGAVVWALFRRYILRPERLKNGFEAAVILITILLLLLTHFLEEALRINMTQETYRSPVSSVLSSVFNGVNESFSQTSYYTLWWFHIFLLLGLLVYIPYSKHLHIIASPFNVFFRSLQPKGTLTPIDIETAQNLGVEKIEEFTWKQLLDLYSCAECGRCQINCPA